MRPLKRGGGKTIAGPPAPPVGFSDPIISFPVGYVAGATNPPYFDMIAADLQVDDTLRMSYTTTGVNPDDVSDASIVFTAAMALSETGFAVDWGTGPFAGGVTVKWKVQYGRGGNWSNWSNILSDGPMPGAGATTVLHNNNAGDTQQSSLIDTSGAPVLAFTGTAGVGACCAVRASEGKTGKRQFEVTVTSLVGIVYIGLDDGTFSIGPSVFTAQGSGGNDTGMHAQLSSGGTDIYKDGAASQVGAANGAIATGDIITVEFDTAAATVSFYRTRAAVTVQIGATVTGVAFTGAAPWWAWIGTSQNATGTVNFGQSAFARALSGGGYQAYGI